MTNNDKTSLSDIPFEETRNDFGTDRYVKGLIRFIENSSTPITIALQGEWGSGKTSLMARLERSLCSQPDSSFIGVKINTWEYSMLSTPEITVYKILSQLVRELTQDDSRSKKTFKGFLRGAGNFLYRGARESLKTIPGVGGMLAVGLEAANIPTQLPDGSDDSETASLADLKDALEQAINKSIAEVNKRGVIIFVDDLDRLNPPVAVEILELLKNVFSLDNCIFVLAIDYEVVVKGLKPKFGELTDSNEREFRSFFDKIIQVPFSLPVSNYRTMDFVLDSLVQIGYIRDIDRGNPDIQAPFSSIVECSVGKNPRSIKRLINTLSLLNCIALCGREEDEFSGSKEAKIINFAIIAIQVCYPKIYRMLTLQPDFPKWGENMLQRMNLSVEKNEDYSDLQWEEVRDAMIDTDPYMIQHQSDITQLLDLIQDMASKKGPENFEKNIRNILDKSSVTGIGSGGTSEELDRHLLIRKLHENVVSKIKLLRPEINIRTKRNTGNGGFYLEVDKKRNDVDIVLNPSMVRNKVSCRLRLDCRILRPEQLLGVSFDELLENEKIASMLQRFDEVIAPLLTQWYFSGKTYDTDINYPNFTEELRYQHMHGWMENDISFNPEYWITLDKASNFEEPEIVSSIASAVLASYDLKVASYKLFE